MCAFSYKDLIIDKKNGLHLANGTSYGLVGFGTGQDKHPVTESLIRLAIETGYCIFDSAPMYKSFREIGKAIRGLNREKLYLISKVSQGSLTRKGVDQEVRKALKELNTNYLDACLIQWPNPNIPIEETLVALEDLQKLGKIRHVGCCNFSIQQLHRALEVGVKITWLQTEMNPGFFDPELIAFCHDKGILIQSWFSLKGSHKNVLLTNIGKKYHKSPEQVALRWIVQKGCIPLTSSQSKQHLQDSLDILDFSLTSQEVSEIDTRARHGERTLFPEIWGVFQESGSSYEEYWPHKKIN